MSVTFFDLQDKHNPRNESVIVDNGALDALLMSLRDRAPFFVELVHTDGYKLLLGVGSDLGCVQFSRADGRPPYYMAAEGAGAESDGFVSFLTGNTPTPIPRRYCMPSERIKGIARDFLKDGQRSPTVEWEEI